jgi:RNA polymerase sigma-B factor
MQTARRVGVQLNAHTRAPNDGIRMSRPPRATEDRPRPTALDEGELWRKLREQRCPRSRDELIRRYLPFARNMALRYRHASEPFDDLMQVASLGLVNAVDRFDPERGVAFIGFAAPTILGELKRHFRDRVWIVRVPRGIHDLMAQVEKSAERLSVELQRSPSVGEIAERLDVDPLDVLDVLEADQKRRPLSLDRPAGGDEEESPAAEWIGDEDENFALVDDFDAIKGAMPQLDHREREVLRLRFAEELSQSQIAARIGYSQMHVSRILRGALERLRAAVEEPSVS